jgi:hypothetical protein
MHPETARLLAAINAAVDGMSDAELAQHPPGKWSPAEILEHLSLTYSGTVRGLGKLLAAGEPKVGPDTPRQKIGRFVVLTLGYMPRNRKAPEFTIPRGAAPADALRTIRQNVRDMDEAISRCEQRFGATRKIGNHPILGPFNVQQWRRFHWVHARHHLRQITRLRAEGHRVAATA